MNSKLVQRSIAAAAWGVSGSSLRILLQIGSQIVLARILGPAQYGVFAIDVLVASLPETIPNAIGYTGPMVLDGTKPDGTPTRLLDASSSNRNGCTTKPFLLHGLTNSCRDFRE